MGSIMESNPPRPSRVLLLTLPRTTSNLFVKILSLGDQSKVHTNNNFGVGYHFFDPFMFIGDSGVLYKPVEERDDLWQEQRKHLDNLFDESFSLIEKTRLEGEAAGKVVFVKEHVSMILEPNQVDKFLQDGRDLGESREPLCYGPGRQSDLNSTVLSDDYLAMWKPMFLIRHPILAFPSYYRVTHYVPGRRPLYPVVMDYSRMRKLYDLFRARNADDQPDAAGSDDDAAPRWPIVLDSDDVLGNPRVIERAATAAGLDAGVLKFSWAPMPASKREVLPETVQNMLKDLHDSDGVRADKLGANARIEDERPKWAAQFGEEVAAMLEERVRAAMPDYEYLRDRRLTA